MHETNPAQPTLLISLRHTVARMMLDYPTDPLNIGQCVAGALMVVVALFTGVGWIVPLTGLLSIATGIAGLLAARRTRFVGYAFRITTWGSTLILCLLYFVLAPYPIWWLLLIPAGAALSGGILYYRGVRLSMIWYVLQALVAAVAMITGSDDPTLRTQALLSGELLMLALHAGLVLFMPEQLEAEARTFAITRQSHELGNLAQQISATADGLSRASSAIHMVTSQQGSGAEQQAAVITEAMTMLNEFLALADQVRTQARSITEFSEQTADVSERGQRAIRMTAEGMSQIRSQTTVIALNIAGLAEQMQHIKEIIASVSEIATQSNLLALNASIEAARAGVHGRGFAVVAEEVRTLSQQSKTAAAQVQNILNEIQGAMKQTVRATELGDQQVDEGMELSEQAGEVITRLANNVTESVTAMRNIMAAIDQQATGMEEISTSMRNLHDVTQKNLESTKTAEIVAENLNRLSKELQTVITVQAGDIMPSIEE